MMEHLRKFGARGKGVLQAGLILGCVYVCGSLATAQSPSREEVAKALEGVSHKRLDVKSAVRFFELIVDFEAATNQFANAVLDYTAATSSIITLEEAHAAAFGLERGKDYFYDRAAGKLYRLDVQTGNPPTITRVEVKDMAPADGDAYTAASAALRAVRAEYAAGQREALDNMEKGEAKVAAVLAAMGKDFGVVNPAWVDMYVAPGSMDVLLVYGQEPADGRPRETADGTLFVHGAEFKQGAGQSVAVAPPPKPRVIPDGAVLMNSVSFTFPENSKQVIARVAEAAKNLNAAEPVVVGVVVEPPAEENGEGGVVEEVEVVELSALLTSGRATVSDGVLTIRSASPEGDIVAKDSVMPAVTNLLAAVRESGYYIAGLGAALEAPSEAGVLTVHVDPGRVGEVRVTFNGRTNELGEAVSDGRWYSGRQIRRRFGNSTQGKPFDYNALYESLSEANENQDLKLDTDVKIRQETDDDGMVARVADLTLDVQERMPIHGGLEVGNDGSHQSGHWWIGGNLRHQNLTKNDDVLSVEASLALEDASLWSLAGSYMLPHYYSGGGMFGVFGGYSKLDINNLVPGIGVSGVGKYFGARISQRMLESRDYRVEAAFGQTYRWSSETLDFDGKAVNTRTSRVAPYFVQLNWQQKKLDAADGRSFAMIEASHNFAGWMGTSESLETQRVGAEKDYTVFRAQAARLQGLGRPEKAVDSRWTVFARAVGQVCTGPLISAEQYGLGGAATVRGYDEREALGDNAAFGSVELRTPILGLVKRDRLQFVTFVDGGCVNLRNRQPGEAGNDTLISLGAGLRYAIWEHAMLRFDWGFPLHETYVTEAGPGRGHLNVQVQF